MLEWVLGNKNKKGKKSAKPKPPYGEAKKIAAEGDVSARRSLAAHEDLEPELLYDFATDEAPEVRRAVAENYGTPLQADVILAKDIDDEVRAQIASKIGRLVPTLGSDATDRLTTMALEVLEIVARDELPRVRAIVSEEIKLTANVPHEIVKRLANDIEDIVATPVLEYSPLLSDRDLLEIIASGVTEGALTALSRRQDLVESVVDAVVAINSVKAMKDLLENTSAPLGEETLDKIAVVAAGANDLHMPMVNRDSLSENIIRRIATFVSAALVDVLIDRHELAPEVAGDLRQAVRKRIDVGDLVLDEQDKDPADERAKEMFEAGTLDEDALLDAIDEKDLAFVRHAVILKSRLSAGVVQKMITSGSGKALTALAWKAGLSMDMALTLQRRLGNIEAKSMVQAASGGGYSMSDEDLQWYVEFYH
jgi:uncharacterized protein (DUF2336 family)